MSLSEDAYDELIGQPWSVREVSRRMEDLRAQGYTANQCYEDDDDRRVNDRRVDVRDVLETADRRHNAGRRFNDKGAA